MTFAAFMMLVKMLWIFAERASLLELNPVCCPEGPGMAVKPGPSGEPPPTTPAPRLGWPGLGIGGPLKLGGGPPTLAPETGVAPCCGIALARRLLTSGPITD